MTISYLELRQENFRDLFGVWWIPLSYLILCSVLAILFIPRAEQNLLGSLLYVYSGFSIWMSINKNISSSVGFFPGKINHYFQNNLRFTDAFVIHSIKSNYILVLNAPFILVLVILNNQFTVSILLKFIAIFFLLLVFNVTTSWLVALSCIIFKWLGGIVSLALRFLFFVTPIFWTIDEGSSQARLLLYKINPLTYFVNFLRNSITNNTISYSEVIGSLLLTSFLLVIAIISYLLIGKMVKNIS